MKVTYYGHSCFSCEIGPHRVLFDPFISPNPLAKEVNVDAIEADFILLTHGHSDHIFDVERIARRTGATVVTVFETGAYLQRQGLEKVVQMNTGGQLKLPFGTVRLVPALHSNQLPDGSYGGAAVGFVVSTPDQAFYYSGDTSLTREMLTIGELYPRLDAAFLCVGGHFTMDVADALIAASWCGTTHVIGMHFDSFPPIAVDHDAAQQLADAAGIDLLLPHIGQTFQL